jgi:hypothetical protein
MRQSNLSNILNEEMSKPEVVSLIKQKIGDNLNSKDFERKVKEISSSVMEEFFKILWQRKSFWKDSVKR